MLVSNTVNILKGQYLRITETKSLFVFSKKNNKVRAHHSNNILAPSEKADHEEHKNIQKFN